MTNHNAWGIDNIRPEDIDHKRLWRLIDINEDDKCWPFRSAMTRNTYGYFNLGTKFGRRRISAARLVLTLKLNRPMKDKMHVCHTCDWPPCCNPAHLIEGTPHDNRMMVPDELRRKVGLPKGHKKPQGHGDKQRSAQYISRMRTCSCGHKTNAGAMSWHLRNREDHFIVP